MIKKSGADYAYIMETFGPFMAFIRLWIECMIVRPCSQAIVALTFSTYVMKPFFPDCQPPEDSARLLAVCCISEYTDWFKQCLLGSNKLKNMVAKIVFQQDMAFIHSYEK